MRLVTFFILLASIVWGTVPSTAQTNLNVYYSWKDYLGTPSSVTKITLTPLAKYGDDGYSLLSPQPISRKTDTNGFYTFTNVIPGFSYQIQLETPYNIVTRTSTFPANLTGTVNGHDYLSAATNAVSTGTQGYSIVAADARFLLKSGGTASNLALIGPLTLTNGAVNGYVLTSTNGQLVLMPAAGGSLANATNNDLVVSNALRTYSGTLVSGTNLIPANTSSDSGGSYTFNLTAGQSYVFVATNSDTLIDGDGGTSYEASKAFVPIVPTGMTMFTLSGNSPIHSQIYTNQNYAGTFRGTLEGDASGIVNVPDSALSANIVKSDRELSVNAGGGGSEHFIKSSNTANKSTLSIQRNAADGYADINFMLGSALYFAIGMGEPGQFPYSQPYIESYLGAYPFYFVGASQIYGGLREQKGNWVWYGTSTNDPLFEVDRPTRTITNYVAARFQSGLMTVGATNTSLTANRAIVTGSNKEQVSSATTDTELGYVSGVTSAIQTQLSTKAPLASPTFTGTITGNGSGLTALNGANLTSGTVNSNALDTLTKAQLALAGGGGGPTLAASQTWTGSNTFTGGIAATGSLLNTNATGNYLLSTNGSLTISNASTAAYIIATNNEVQSQHFGGIKVSTGPSIAAGAGAGTSPTVNFSTDDNPNDSAMRIHVVTGTSPTASAIIATVTFSKAWTTKPKVLVKLTTKGQGVGPTEVTADATTVSTTAFDLVSGGSALTGATTYDFDVICVR